MIDNPLCLLAIEERPNSFMPIDLKALGIGLPSTSITLRELDHLLFVHTTAFIKELIKVNNVVPGYDLSQPLVILYDDENNRKRKLSLIPEEYYFNGNIREILFDNIDDKKIINQLINKILSLPIEDNIKTNLVSLLKNGFIEEFVIIFNTLPYLIYRNLFLYIGNIINKKNKLVREKNAEEVE